MNAYNTKVEGVMRNHTVQLWSSVVFLVLASLASTAGIAASPPSLAIMNFTNQSLDDPEWQWLSKGLSDMLVTDLTRVRKFQIVDRESVRDYLQEMDLPQTGLVDRQTALMLGRVASVSMALFGNYKITDGRIVIQAFLVNIESNDIERVETISGPVTDVLNLEKTLALRIVENLHVPLTQAELDSIKFKPTDSLDATTRFYGGLDAYDQGQYFEGLRQFRLAEKADPNYDKPLLFQGHVFENLGEYEHAILAYRKLASQIPNSEFVVDGLISAAKLSANEFQRYDDAFRIADHIIDTYPDGAIRDGTVIAKAYAPAPAIVVRGNRYSVSAVMRLYKSSLYVRLEDYHSAMREVEYSAAGTPRGYQLAYTHFLRDLVKFAYEQTGEVLIPASAPKVIELDPTRPTYAEDYASDKRLRDTFTLESTDSEWRGEIIKPYGYDGQSRQHYISNKYSTVQKAWMTTADRYLFAVPQGYVVESVDVWLDGYQTQPWTLDALVVAVGDYNSKGATGGPRRGHTKDHYRAPVLAGTQLFELLIQVAGDFTKPADQFAYISNWKIKANLKEVAETAALTINSNTNVLVFVDPVPGQVRDAQSIFWRGNPSIDCPCRVNNLPAGPHRLVTFAADEGHSIKRDGRRREFLVDIRPDRVNEIAVNYPVLQVHNNAMDVLPGWESFHRVLSGYTRVGAGGKVGQLAGMQSRDESYHVLFTKDFDIWRATSADGATWTAASPLPGPINSQSLEGDFSIIQGEDDVYYLAFLSARGGSNGIYVSSSRDMIRWQKPRKVVSLKHDQTRPSLLQLQDGRFRLYYPPANHRVAYVASEDFRTWTEGSETKVEYQDFAQVALDESGIFWLLYGGYEGRDHLFFISSSQDGEHWQDFKRIDISHTDHNLGSFHPKLVPTPTTGVALAWERTARLAFSRTNDGVGWSPSSAELESGGKLGYPDAPFAFFRKLDRGYMLVYPNSHDELWSASSSDPFQ